MADGARGAAQRARRRRRRIGIGAAATVTAVALGSGAAIAMSSHSGPVYRLATATESSVDQTLTSVGTLAPVNQATVAFAVAGTVDAVDVAVGQHVTAGQPLASLNTTALQQQVTSATAQVAAAQQTLANDQASQTATTASTTTAASTATSATAAAASTGTAGASAATSTPTAAPTATKADRTPSPSGSAAKAVTSDQQRLLAAQRTLDDDLSRAEQALQTCRNDLGGVTLSMSHPPAPPGPTASASATPSATASASTSPTANGSGAPTATGPGPSPTATGSTPPPSGPSSAQVAGCLAAITAAPDQASTRADRAAVSAAEAGLTKAVVQLSRAASAAAGSASKGDTATSAGSSRTGTTQSAAGSVGSTVSRTSTGSTAVGNSGSGSAGTRGGVAGPATAEQLAADQAQIDALNAALVVTRKQVTETRLTSPIDGTVAALGLTNGAAVGASSASNVVTIIGAGQTEVTTTVPLTAIASVKVGQATSIAVDGTNTPYTGKVTAIGLLSSTTGTTISYPVTVLLDVTGTKLVDGAGASVTIDIASAPHVLTVPSSAVHVLGRAGTVTVLKNGKATLTRVTLGAVGLDRTQITSGLVAGDQVVLATLNAPLPTATGNTGVARRLGVTSGGGALGTGGALTGGTTRGGG